MEKNWDKGKVSTEFISVKKTIANNVHIQFGGFGVIERVSFIITFDNGGQFTTWSPCRPIGLNKAPNPPNCICTHVSGKYSGPLGQQTNMRFLKSLPIVIVLTAMILVYAMTRSYDPLKTYHYTLTRDELEERLIQITKSKSNLTFNLTDSTGTDKTDLNYYADLVIKTGTEEYEYNFKYNKETSFWDKDVKSEISLVGAFDKIRKTGGYKTDDTDVAKMINVFETELIKELDGMNTSR